MKNNTPVHHGLFIHSSATKRIGANSLSKAKHCSHLVDNSKMQ